jgi:hypothetical protein
MWTPSLHLGFQMGLNPIDSTIHLNVNTSMITCDICKQGFANKKIYANHVRWHHKDNSNNCKFCGKPSKLVNFHEPLCHLNPDNIRKCLQCDKILSAWGAKFCSRECSGKFNTSKRTKQYLKQLKQKHSLNLKNTLCKHCKVPIKINSRASSINSCCGECKKIATYNCTCKVCGKNFSHLKRSVKTCGKQCYKKLLSSHSTNNPNCGGETNFKRFKYNGVIFDSSWEVDIAKFLNKNKIKWQRSRKIVLIWVDYNNNKRRYYPDFYLPKYDLYLDPKNKYKQKLDQEKLDYIAKSYNIVYGDVHHCKQKLLDLMS